jgi:hypothetical protein
MKIKYQSPQSYDYKSHRKKKEWGDYIVTPSMALSLKEITERVIQGRPVPDISKEAFQADDPTNLGFDDVNPLSKSVDPLTTMDNMKSELKDLEGKRAKREAQKKEADEKARIESEARKLSEKMEAERKKAEPEK